MAGLFGDLFLEDKNESALDEESSFGKSGIVSPPRARLQCGLAGIDNQGATCYLNSLIQTLLYTSEFRESLFCLEREELGSLDDIDKPDAKVRVIPIQLQRLFARLLLKNCQSVSTVELTTSFGWTDHEQFQQHDVQELNRILFSAIDSSLVGTSGRDIITHLYHGKLVNQIRCTQCGNVSEREEDFLDLAVTVSGNVSLEQALLRQYIDVEMLNGKNQYRCGSCQRLVDAAKGARIRSLPAILTVSLLRFSFNFQRMERFKETGRFTFPQSIDMQPYCDNPTEDQDYELFSVVIHGGGAHGGHYHAYIRDIDGLGTWVTPEDEEILIPKDARTGGVDFIECDSPIELVQYTLSRETNHEMAIDKLGQEILKQTGRSWNKRFKNKYGPITKFVTKYDDKFIYDPASKRVSLKMFPQNSGDQTVASHCDNSAKYVINANKSDYSTPAAKGGDSIGTSMGDNQATVQGDSEDNIGVTGAYKINEGLSKGPGGDLKSLSTTRDQVKPPAGRCWFDFNDSRVHPIHEKTIEKQFSGRECAYMLFYRKKSLRRPDKAVGNKTYGIPGDLVAQVIIENQELDRDREVYDVMVNTVTLQIHFGRYYRYIDGALKPLPGVTSWRELSIDRRKTTEFLFTAIREFGPELVPAVDFQVTRMKELPAGSHLYDTLPEPGSSTLQQLDIKDGSRLFVWDGESVEGEYVPTGQEAEPVFLTVIYGEKLQFSRGFSRAMTLLEVKVIICDIIRTKFKDLILKRLSGKNTGIKAQELSSREQNSLVSELNLADGDQLLAVDRLEKGPGMSDESIRSTLFNTKFLIHLENRCVQLEKDQYDYPAVKVEVDREICVAELKTIALSKFGLCRVDGGGRLRIEHDTLGLRHPIHEEFTVFESGITQGSTVILEPGPTPESGEITLTVMPDTRQHGTDFIEVMVKRNITVAQCLQCLLEKANITEGDWHLRKTNWCGEAAELLDDPDLSLEASLVNDGDHLLLERGRLPPKGFLRLPIWLYSTPESVKTFCAENSGMLSWISTGICNILQTNTQSSGEPERNNKVSTKLQPFYLGEVEISKDATLVDLKLQVMTLNVVAELPLPSESFMRLRLLENNRLSTVLRDKQQTLKRLRLTSSSVLALQILPEEEDLNHHQLVLDVCQRVPDTRRYHPHIELIWDTSQGASIHSLLQAVLNVLYIPTEHLAMAKHFPQRYEWMVIEKSEESGQQKGKRKGNTGKNIKHAPFHIRDGDTIGVKDKQCDPNDLDSFMTDADEVGRILLSQEAEEKRKIREERKKTTGEFGQWPREKRPEVGIKIKVGDFT